MFARSLRVALVALLPAVGSCGGSARLHEVDGSVTYGGQPLAAGQIFFDPDYLAGNDGPAGVAVIKNGRFDTRQQGRGVIGGPYTIRIDGFDGKPGAELPLGRPLFATYREKRDLPKRDSTQEFDVPRSK